MRAAAAAAAIAALAYSSFLLSGWLDPAGFSTTGFISELSEPGRPGAEFYRVTDLIAGIALLVVAVGVARRVAGSMPGRVAAVLLALTGLGSLLDGQIGMGCDPSVSVACAASQHTIPGMLAALADVHTLSATVAFVGCAAGPVLLGAAVNDRHLAWAWLSTGLGVLVAVLGLADLALLLAGADPGIAERARTVVSSLWFLAVGVLLLRREPARQLDRTGVLA